MRTNLLTVALLLIGLWIAASRPSSAQIAPTSLHPAPVAVDSGQLRMLGTPGARGMPESAAQPAATTVLFGETFEGAWPGASWTLFDRSNSGDEYLWGQRSCQPLSGTYGGMAAGGGSIGSTRSCSSTYPDNVESWAIYGPLDLSGVTTATLTFFVKGKTQGPDIRPVDYLFVGSSSDGNNFNGGITGGDLSNGPFAHGYYGFTFDMTNLAGQSQVWVAFVFVSNQSVAESGLTIDDIQLEVQYNTPTPTNTLTPTNTPTPTNSPTPTATATSTPTPSPTSVPTALPTATPNLLQNPHRYLPMLIYTFSPPDCPGAGTNTRAIQAAPISADGRSCAGSFRAQAEGTSQWYSVDLGAGQTIAIDLTDIPAGADYDIYLFDAQVLTSSTAQFVAHSNKNANADEQISYQSPTAARYYLRVVLATKTTAGPNTYLLAVANH